MKPQSQGRTFLVWNNLRIVKGLKQKRYNSQLSERVPRPSHRHRHHPDKRPQDWLKQSGSVSNTQWVSSFSVQRLWLGAVGDLVIEVHFWKTPLRWYIWSQWLGDMSHWGIGALPQPKTNTKTNNWMGLSFPPQVHASQWSEDGVWKRPGDQCLSQFRRVSQNKSASPSLIAGDENVQFWHYQRHLSFLQIEKLHQIVFSIIHQQLIKGCLELCLCFTLF